MASSGPLYPSTQTETGSGNSWTNKDKANGAPNDDGATLSANGATKTLRSGPDGLGFAIPAGSTINGIVVTVYSKGGLLS